MMVARVWDLGLISSHSEVLLRHKSFRESTSKFSLLQFTT